MERLADAGFAGFKLSVVVTRQNVGQLDAFKAIADRYGAQLRLTRLRPSGRGADVLGRAASRPPSSSGSSTTGCSTTARRS